MVSLEARGQAVQAKIKEVRDALKVPMVSVLPRDEKIRKYIAHMPGNIKFPKEGPARWPFDTFTKRRIRDGDVTLFDEKAKAEFEARAEAKAESEAHARFADESPAPEGEGTTAG